MDSTQLLVELLRLIADAPPEINVEVGGPSPAVQIAQVCAPFVALVAVGVAFWSQDRANRHNVRALKQSQRQHEAAQQLSQEHHEAALKAADEARYREAGRTAIADAVDAIQAYLNALKTRAAWTWRVHNNAAYRRRVQSGQSLRDKALDDQFEEIRELETKSKALRETARQKTNLAQLYFPLSTAVGTAVATAYKSTTLADDGVRRAWQEVDEKVAQPSLRAATDDLAESMKVIGEFARGEAAPTAAPEPGARVDLSDWWAE